MQYLLGGTIKEMMEAEMGIISDTKSPRVPIPTTLCLFVQERFSYSCLYFSKASL